MEVPFDSVCFDTEITDCMAGCKVGGVDAHCVVETSGYPGML